MRKLAKEAWFAKHREAETLDLSIRDMMLRLCVVVEEAKQLNADEAAQYIINFKQSVLLSVVNNTFQKYSQYQYIYFMKKVLAIPISVNELQKYHMPYFYQYFQAQQYFFGENSIASRPISAIIKQPSVHNY